MNKKIKNLVLAAFAIVGLAGMTVSCNKDEINSLNDRVAKVESALQDLQTQISDGAVITGVESTANGVTVTLSDGSSFTLTNGADGQNGADGADGVRTVRTVRTVRMAQMLPPFTTIPVQTVTS